MGPHNPKRGLSTLFSSMAAARDIVHNSTGETARECISAPQTLQTAFVNFASLPHFVCNL